TLRLNTADVLCEAPFASAFLPFPAYLPRFKSVQERVGSEGDSSSSDNQNLTFVNGITLPEKTSTEF
ncbi:unnamed protein product, partial [Rangifer tarandus platyrhynchus]